MDVKCPKCAELNDVGFIASFKLIFGSVIICKKCFSRIKLNMVSSAMSYIGFLLAVCSMQLFGSANLNHLCWIILGFILLILCFIFIYLGDNIMPRFKLDDD